MGCCISSPPPTLSPGLPEAFVVFDQKFIVPAGAPLFLHFRAKLSWSADDFIISNAQTGQKWFSVDGQAFSLNQKKFILDLYGNQVFTMQENAILDDKQTVYTPDGREIFAVSSNFGNTKQSTQVTTLGPNGRWVEINMRADFWGSNGAIFIGPLDTGVAIATFHSPTELQNFLPGRWAQDDYFVKIAPGVDAAFIVAMMVAYNEMNDSYKEDEDQGVMAKF